MIEASGKITALDGDYAHVSISGSGCGRCHEEGGCGGHNLGQMLCVSPKTYRVLNPRHVGLGEDVIVVIDRKSVYRGALLAYGFPLLALLAGALTGGYLFGEAGSIAGAVVGLALSWITLRIRGKSPNEAGGDAQPFIK